MLVKQIKEESKKWNDIPFPSKRIVRINILKMAISSKAMCKFSMIPIKIPKTFFTELEQIIQKFL